MKPFDLEKALAGEPVKLRNGWKAYVKYVMPDEYCDGYYPLKGFSIKSNNEGIELSWTKEGKDTSLSVVSDLDIISMWEEPRPKVQLDLPCPLKEPQEGMWYLHPQYFRESSYSLDTHDDWISRNKIAFKNGFYFATQEDAQEWLDAIKGARR